MTHLNIALALSLLLGLNLTANAWLFPTFKQRTAVTVPSGQNDAMVEIHLDTKRFAKATGLTALRPEHIALAAETTAGETAIPFTVPRQTGESGRLCIRFRHPRKPSRVLLYFDGTGATPKNTPPEENLLRHALEQTSRTDWKANDTNVTVMPAPQGLRLKLKGNGTPARHDTCEVTRRFPLPKDIQPGSQVFLEFDGRSHAKVMWPLQLVLHQVDQHGEKLPETVFDPRWLMLQTAPGKPVRIRQQGKLDPRATALQVTIRALRCKDIGLFDTDGRPLENPAECHPDITITRLELRAAAFTTIPGPNPRLYTQGDRPNTHALNMLGHTAPMFNNFPASVWAGGNTPNSQQRFFWPQENGTVEFRIKPQWTKDHVVLVDNGRKNGTSFLKLSYHHQNRQLTINMDDVIPKPITRKINLDIPNGTWSHLAMTWSLTEGIALFLNGTKAWTDRTVRLAPIDFGKQAKTLPEYTTFGADCRRFHRRLGTAHTMPFFKGALDSIRVSKTVRYNETFKPAPWLPIDQDTCAAFDFEQNLDGQTALAGRWISGTIYAADEPPRDDRLTIERHDGTETCCQYVPKDIPPDNMPQDILTQTCYPELPTARDFFAARKLVCQTLKLTPGERKSLDIPPDAVMHSVKITCPKTTSKLQAPLLKNETDVDPRSYADIARGIQDMRNLNDHQKATRAFDFLMTSSDYFTFQGAEFAPGKNIPHTAEHDSLLAINSYACFECGPLNSIALGLFVNGFGWPAVMTFGNGHLFQQVSLGEKLRVFDLSARQFFPSRDMDDAAGLEDLEKDIFLFVRTKAPTNSANHFFRMNARGLHSGMSQPPPRLTYTLYPGESFQYFWANNGESNNLNVPGWQNKATFLCKATWKDVKQETGSDGRIGTVQQRPLPHVATGFFTYDGPVTTQHGAFTSITPNSFCYRIHSPFTILSGTYQSGDRHAQFLLSWNHGKTWRKLTSKDGLAQVTLPIRARHAVLLKVITDDRQTFKAKTVVQMNPRRLTGQVKPGKNTIVFTADQGNADVDVRYAVPVKEIRLEGGFYFGTIIGCERQLFTMTPNQRRTIQAHGLSPHANVMTTGDLKASIHGQQLILTVPKNAPRQFACLQIRDGDARKYAEVLIAPNLRTYTAKELFPQTCRPQNDSRPMPMFCGKTTLNTEGLPPGSYVLFTHTRKDNRQSAYVQALLWMPDGKEWVAARIRNPGTDYYKASYGNGIWSRFRWDFSTGKDNYPRRSTTPALLTLKGQKGEAIRFHCSKGECGGAFLLPADDMDFVYETIRTLTPLNRADALFAFPN